MSRPARKAFDPRSEGSTSRLQTLADGFFAVAMTLLVLDLSAGTMKQPVTDVLKESWPHLLLFFDGMLVLGALWFGHRNAFEYIRRTDHPHTWLTLAMLAFVAVVPWTTALVAQHRHSPLAITVYTANLATGLAWLSTWAALALVALLPLLPISGISYRVQYRLGNET